MGKLFLIIIFCCNNLFAQNGWQQIPIPPNTSYTFNTMFFVTKDTGFLYYKQNSAPYFRNGTIYITTNGGSTFFAGPGVMLTYAHFLNNNTGWLLGWTETYEIPGKYYRTYKTTNAGVNWTEEELFSNVPYTNCIKFVNQNTGWKTKSDGSGLFKTTNGGTTWDSVAGNFGNTLVNYFTVNIIDSVNSIYRLTTFYNGPGVVIKYSTNSGLTWTQSTVSFNTIRSKPHYEFINGTCILTTSSIVQKTTNYGVNWSSTLSINAFRDLSTFDNQNVWGLTQEGNISCSTNGGVSFNTQLATGYRYDSSFVFMFPADSINHVTGYLNAGGKLYKTTTGGQTITNASSNEALIPKDFGVSIFPNPFNPATKVKVELPHSVSSLTINLYDLTGKLVKAFTYSNISIGTNEFTIETSELPTGTYFLKTSTENFSVTRKIVLLK